MAIDIEAVNKIISNYVADVKAVLPIDKVYLYGSYAKGTQTEHSDIDVCFFSKHFEERETFDILCDLFDLALKYPHVDIEPRAFSTSEIERGNPFVKEILRTGREIIV